jgi:hypothetical protein
MADVTVSFDGTRLDDAEDTTDWSGSQEPDFVYQNTYSVSTKTKTSELGPMYTHPSTTNFAVGPKVALFKTIVTTVGILNVEGATGAICEIGSGGEQTNYYRYYIAGSDTYPPQGGWLITPIDPNIVGYVDNTPGTAPDPTIIDYLGWVATMTSSSAKSENVAMDAVDYVTSGTGLTLINGGGISTSGVFADFIDYDEGTKNNRYGIVTSRGGILYVAGFLTIGTATETDFADAGAILVFPDGRFGPSFAGIKVGLANVSSEVLFTSCIVNGRGSASGSADTRPTIYVAGTTGSFSADACTFDVLRRLKLNSASAVNSTTVSNAGQIDPTNSDYSGNMSLPATDEYVDTQENPDLSSTSGDFEVIMRTQLDDWTPASEDCLACQSNDAATASQQSFRLTVSTTPTFRLYVSDGSSITQLDSSTLPTAWVDNVTWVWVRVTYDQSAGQANFYYSEDHEDTPVGDISWTALGTPSGTSRLITQVAYPLMLGAESAGTPTNFLAGSISYFEIWTDGFQAPGASHGDLISRADWRTGPDFTGTPATRVDDFDTTGLTWEEQGTAPVYTTADDNSGAADLGECTITDNTSEAAIRWNVNSDPNGELDNISFTSLGTGHAMEFGPLTPSTITLTGHVYSNYAASHGSTGNEVIYNNSGKALTINYSGTAPTYRNGTGASTTLVNSLTLTITGIPNPSEVRIYESGTSTELDGQEVVTLGQFLYVYDAGDATDDVDIRILSLGYNVYKQTYTLQSSDQNLPVVLQVDRTYVNP